MAELIHRRAEPVVTSRGVVYQALVYGDERTDGTWEGWLEFHPLEGGHHVLRTERETSQPNKAALVYWSSGLEAVYIEGALARAR
jgi:hypothetical protein